MDDSPLPLPLTVHETVLYADDVAAASAFYAEVLGLRPVFGPTPTMVALRIGPPGTSSGVLLLFDPGASAVPGRDVPSHGARGEGHVAFTVDAATRDAVLDRAAAHGAAVESEVTWPRGGTSTYLRDPAGNSVELVVGEIWPD